VATQKKIVLTAEDRTKGAFRSAQRNMGKLESATAGLQKAFAVLAGAYGLQLVARSFINAADKATQLENKLQLVTHGTKDLTRVYGKLFQVSKDTRVSFEATSELYARLARSSDHLGLSEEQLFQITTSLNQAFAVSGAGIMETSSAVRQLGQGLASGRLAGDELRSIMENAPRVAKMIADGMGIHIGQLRRLGSEGKLNAESVTQAILKMGYEVKAEFEKTSGTVSQATTAMSDSWMNFVNVFDESTGTSGIITLGLQRLSRGLDYFARTVSGEDPFELWGDSLKTLGVKLTQTYDDLDAWQDSKILQGLLPEFDESAILKLQAIREAISKKTGEYEDVTHLFAEDEKVVEALGDAWTMVKNESTGALNIISGITEEQRDLLEETLALNRLREAGIEALGIWKSQQEEIALKTETERRALQDIVNLENDVTRDLDKRMGLMDKQKALKDQSPTWNVKLTGFGPQLQQADALRDARLKAIEEAYGTEMHLHHEMMDQKKLAEQAHADDVALIHQQSATSYAGQMAGMAAATKDMSKEAFELWKALAISQATMNAFLAYTKVLGDPTVPVWLQHGVGMTMMGLSLAYASKISSMSYPGKEKGGNVIGGKSYIVGERGPEVFTPGSTGGITPNNKLGGTTNVNFQVTAVDTRNFDVLLQSRRGLIVSMINQAMNRAGRQGLI